MSETTATCYYRPSLRVPLQAIPCALVCAAIALPFALLYGWFSSSLPLHSRWIVHLFVMLGYTGCLCVVSWLAASIGKVRHPKWMGWIGAAIGLIGWYGQWAAYIAFSIPVTSTSTGHIFLARQLAADPIQLFGLLYQGQASTILSHPVLGTLTVVAWLFELIILVASAGMVGSVRASDPFCERSNKWATSVPFPHLFTCIEAPASAVQRLEAEPEDIFSILIGSVEDRLPFHWKVTLYHCPVGEVYATVRRVDNKKVSTDLSGVPRFLVENLKLEAGDLDEVQRKFAEAASHTPTPPELVDAVAALKDERYQEAFDIAAPHVSSDYRSLKVDALRLCGLANARLERWSGASEAFVALFSEEPTAHNALQVATSSVMAGEVEQGEKWVSKALDMNRDDRTVRGLGVLTTYTSALSKAGHMKLAMPYLAQLKECYECLNITDSTFLWLRGVPFFESFLEQSAPVVRAALDATEGRQWYESMLPHLDQPGKDLLSEWLQRWPGQDVDMEC